MFTQWIWQARDHKLSVVSRPEALKKWVNSGRDFYKIPSTVHPLNSFITNFINWYRSLQPPSRSWPAVAPYPSLTGPDTLEEWGELRKAGPNGIFTVLMGLSWICQLAEKPDHFLSLEWLSADISFVIERVSGLAASKQTSQIDTKKTSAKRKQLAKAEVPNKKRKGSSV
jgi:hypothetical protein